MNIHSLQHVGFEGPAQIAAWGESRRHKLSATHLYRSEKLPSIADIDLLLVMGGPMGATDDGRFPWMRSEKVFIEAMMKREKKVLGVCLGAQLIADVLGARVYPNREKEIGWFPIELDPPNARQSPLSVLNQRSTVFHWHGDTFDLPKGAAHLARSQACENQAFSVGPKVLALQFHIEMGQGHIESMVASGADELHPATFVQSANEILEDTRRYAGPLEMTLFRFLDAFAAA